jgi:S-layer homology domain
LGTIWTAALAPLDCGTLTVDLSAAQYTVDNHKHLLFLFAREDQLVTNLLLAGVAIGYKLQVSPAPATATFNDAPTTDPGFQYIEALAASGITGGCGGGSDCPDSSLTRRQMAIFLAKALGLSY